MMCKFNEDTRVKIPATLHFIKIGYSYQSKNYADIDFNTKIFVNRFKPALEKINDKSFNDSDIAAILSEVHALIRNNDLGRSWYMRLVDESEDIRLWDEGTKNGPDRSALLGHNFVYQETKPHGFYSSYFHQRISS